MVRISLPWPDKSLASNARVHWRAKANSARKARLDAFWLSKEEKVERDPMAILRITCHPPDKRRRDVQNMPSMLKNYIDGIADAMGCDDHKFRVRFPDVFAEVRPGGMVTVEIMRGDDDVATD